MIKEIVLDIDGKKVSLTLEQARALKYELDGLLGVREYIPIYPVYPYTWTSGTASGKIDTFIAT